MSKVDGADIRATRGEEILYFGFYYDDKLEQYVPMDEDIKNYTEEYWAWIKSKSVKNVMVVVMSLTWEGITNKKYGDGLIKDPVLSASRNNSL